MNRIKRKINPNNFQDDNESIISELAKNKKWKWKIKL